jgi:hypothetical protein
MKNYFNIPNPMEATLDKVLKELESELLQTDSEYKLTNTQRQH